MIPPVDMEAIVTQVALWAIVGVLGWLAGRLAGAAKSDREEREALYSGVRALLRSELMRVHHDAVRDGCMSTVDKEVMSRTYSAYHKLGGNDVATNLYQEAMKLPTLDKPRD